MNLQNLIDAAPVTAAQLTAARRVVPDDVPLYRVTILGISPPDLPPGYIVCALPDGGIVYGVAPDGRVSS